MREEAIMYNRRRLRRERLEIYLVYLIRAYRGVILISGLLLLGYAMMVMFSNIVAGSILLLPAIYLLLVSNSDHVTLYTARLGAWIGTLGGKDD